MGGVVYYIAFKASVYSEGYLKTFLEWDDNWSDENCGYNNKHIAPMFFTRDDFC